MEAGPGFRISDGQLHDENDEEKHEEGQKSLADPRNRHRIFAVCGRRRATFARKTAAVCGFRVDGHVSQTHAGILLLRALPYFLLVLGVLKLCLCLHVDACMLCMLDCMCSVFVYCMLWFFVLFFFVASHNVGNLSSITSHQLVFNRCFFPAPPHLKPLLDLFPLEANSVRYQRVSLSDCQSPAAILCLYCIRGLFVTAVSRLGLLLVV